MVFAIDFETNSLNFWSPTFEVRSLAVSYRNESGELISRFTETNVYKWLKQLADKQVPVIVYNAGFELGVLNYCFPDIKLNIHADVMRLVQVFDCGTKDYHVFLGDCEDEDEEYEKRMEDGFGLKVAGPRILGDAFNDTHETAYAWVRSNLDVKRGKEGAFLGSLPGALLRDYNCGDTENTLKLYEKITQEFKRIDYDWKPDHLLYMNVTRLIVQSKARGVSVDREKLAAYVVQVEAEIKEIEQKFCNALAGPIEEVQRLKLEEAKAKYKTEKGRAGAKVDDFNPGSNKQLTTLFVTVMKQPVQFTSATGQPSFKKAHLHTWGDGGEILLARRQRMLVLKQAQNLLKLSEEDGRWHVGLKTVGTSSGRFAGGS
jgi:hypothetical protein